MALNFFQRIYINMNKYYVTVTPYLTCWYLDPECSIHHRTDGPAMIWADGSESWWLDNKRHRTNGPALTFVQDDGSITKHWFINGFEFSESTFNKMYPPPAWVEINIKVPNLKQSLARGKRATNFNKKEA